MECPDTVRYQPSQDRLTEERVLITRLNAHTKYKLRVSSLLACSLAEAAYSCLPLRLASNARDGSDLLVLARVHTHTHKHTRPKPHAYTRAINASVISCAIRGRYTLVYFFLHPLFYFF